jgi:nucleotide-binding universal stress UspA family protein
MSTPKKLSHVLVGVAFDAVGAAAVDAACEHAAAHGARLSLIRASGLKTALADEQARHERTRLDQEAARCRARGLEVVTDIVLGFADVVLLSAARASRPDLVVVGTHGRTGAERWLLGSVAERVARETAGSVLVVKRPYEATLPRRILVATDFSEHARAALEMACVVAPPGARIDLVHAAEPGVDVEREAALAGADPAREVRFALLGGERSPVDALTTHVARGEHDLLVVGSRGRRGLGRVLLGSVAERLLHAAPCNVLVVHGAGN